MNKIKFIIIMVVIFALSGCTYDKCVKSHKEQGRCVRQNCIMVGKILSCVPTFYECEKDVCDEYAETEFWSK